MKHQVKFLLIPHHLTSESAIRLHEALAKECSVRSLSLLEEPWKHTKYFMTPSHDSFESYVTNNNYQNPTENYLYQKYPRVPWSLIVASERSFTDYSFLFGSTGHRNESFHYIKDLLLNTVKFFEHHIEDFRPDGIVTAYGDNIFNFVAGAMAEHYGIKLFIPQPAFITGSSEFIGGFLGNDIFLRSKKMKNYYDNFLNRRLTQEDLKEVESIKANIVAYNGAKTLNALYGDQKYNSALSPQLRGAAIAYIFKNITSNKKIYFLKISIFKKIFANILRIYRSIIGSVTLHFVSNQPPPDKYVYFPMHYQPEASTLVAGPLYSNQIALIENISKILPVGYKLCVREHPRGRYFRPPWQYRHLSRLYNVQFSDRDPKELIRNSKLVITVSGSSALEAAAMDRLVVILGSTYYDFNEGFIKAKSVNHLEMLLRELLIEFDSELMGKFIELNNKFFLSYVRNIFPCFPGLGNEEKLAREIISDYQLKKTMSN